jgi:hypothetical protein
MDDSSRLQEFVLAPAPSYVRKGPSLNPFAFAPAASRLFNLLTWHPPYLSVWAVNAARISLGFFWDYPCCSI